MKSMTIITNPNYEHNLERVSIRLVVPAPISPPDLVPPVLGHWRCETTSRDAGCFVEGRSGHYHVRRGLPTQQTVSQGQTMDRNTWLPGGATDRDKWLPAGGRDLNPPYAFFFDPLGIGGLSSPAFLLSEFDLYAERPDDWFGTGRLRVTTGVYNMNEARIHWEVA